MGYRYGFNGMERDDNVKGAGNSYTTEFRQYDPRVGRWLSLDPLAYKSPGWTPYRAFFNNPIIFIDPDGRFETKKEAKQYAKDNDINTNIFFGDSKIHKGKDGTFSINNKSKNSSIFRDKEFGLQNSALISGKDKTLVSKLNKIRNQPSDNLHPDKYKNPSYVEGHSDGARQKGFLDRLEDLERWFGTESEGSSHGHDDLENDHKMGKPGEFDPFEGWGSSHSNGSKVDKSGFIQEKGLPGDTIYLGNGLFRRDTIYINRVTGERRKVGREIFGKDIDGGSIKLQLKDSNPSYNATE